MTRALLEQALKFIDANVPMNYYGSKLHPLKVAIRDYLAQPQGEPALCHGILDKDCNYMMSCGAVVCNKCGRKHRGITHPSHTEAEVQELWRYADYDGHAEVVIRRILGVPAP